MVADPSGAEPDPDPTLKKIPGLDPTVKKIPGPYPILEIHLVPQSSLCLWYIKISSKCWVVP